MMVLVLDRCYGHIIGFYSQVHEILGDLRRSINERGDTA